MVPTYCHKHDITPGITSHVITLSYYMKQSYNDMSQFSAYVKFAAYIIIL